MLNKLLDWFDRYVLELSREFSAPYRLSRYTPADTIKHFVIYKLQHIHDLVAVSTSV